MASPAVQLTLVMHTADASDQLEAVFRFGIYRQCFQDLDTLLRVNDPVGAL